MEKYDVFISYRRDGGDDLAGRLCDRLTADGYKVFYDIESMRSGQFNTQILNAIAMCKDVIVVLPPNALDRCVNDDDWVRQELAFAIKQKKNIVPILMRGFEFPNVLPNDIADIKLFEGVVASRDYFDAVVARIESLLKTKTKARKNQPVNKTSIKTPLFLKTPLCKINFNGEIASLFKNARKNYNTLVLCGSIDEYRNLKKQIDRKDNISPNDDIWFSVLNSFAVQAPILMKNYFVYVMGENLINDDAVNISLQLKPVVDTLINGGTWYDNIMLIEIMFLYFELERYPQISLRYGGLEAGLKKHVEVCESISTVYSHIFYVTH